MAHTINVSEKHFSIHASRFNVFWTFRVWLFFKRDIFFFFLYLNFDLSAFCLVKTGPGRSHSGWGAARELGMISSLRKYQSHLAHMTIEKITHFILSIYIECFKLRSQIVTRVGLMRSNRFYHINSYVTSHKRIDASLLLYYYATLNVNAFTILNVTEFASSIDLREKYITSSIQLIVFWIWIWL